MPQILFGAPDSLPVTIMCLTKKGLLNFKSMQNIRSLSDLANVKSMMLVMASAIIIKDLLLFFVSQNNT